MNSGILRAGEGRAAWVVGDLYTVKASGADTGGAFALIEVLVPPQSGPPPHVHSREDEAFYVLEGEFEVHVDDPGRSALARPQDAAVHGKSPPLARAHDSCTVLNRSAFTMTETELKLIAAAAIIGLSNRCAEMG